MRWAICLSVVCEDLKRSSLNRLELSRFIFNVDNYPDDVQMYFESVKYMKYLLYFFLIFDSHFCRISYFRPAI